MRVSPPAKHLSALAAALVCALLLAVSITRP
jgi:hypothetical protein